MSKPSHLQVWPLTKRIPYVLMLFGSTLLVISALLINDAPRAVLACGLLAWADNVFDRAWKKACQAYGVDENDTSQ